MADRYYTNQYTGDKIITWKNFTDTSTPLSAANLQKSHSAINAVDQSVRAAFNSVDNTKLDKTAAASMISDIEFNQTTGVLIFHHYDTSISDIVFNTNLQKVVVNFTYDPATQSLVLTQADNTVVRINLSDFISTPDVANSDTVAWTINQDGSVSADIIDGSITEDKLEEHYLESILDQVATVSRLTNNSEYFSKLAKSYANGSSNIADRPNENVDNSKYYMEQSQRSAIICGSILHIAGEKASDSEAYGAGTRDGEPVSSDDPAYHNNSKYYMEEAKEAVIEHLPVMTGATATTDGQQGAAPKPLAGQQDDLLTGGAQYKSLDQLGIQKQVLASAMTIGGQVVTEVEEALNALNEKPAVNNYNDLQNKPQINSNTLSGNKTGAQLGLQNIVLSSTLSIGGQTITEVEPALRALNEKGGGHTILDEDGNTYPQRSKLQFEGCEITDDAVNGVTVVKCEGGGGSKISISTNEPSLQGKTVTVTGTSETKTATIGNDGKAVIDGFMDTGSATISASDGIETASVTISIPYFGNYAVTLSFWAATLSITTDSPDLYGQTITVKDSNNQTVATSVFSAQGTATATVNSTGTYTVSTTGDGVTVTESVTVSAQTTYNVSLHLWTATVSISTSSSDLYGATITVKKGGSMVGTTSFSAQGSATYKAHETGEYTFECTYSGQTYSDSVTVSAETSYTAEINTNITITVTLYSAAADTVSFTDLTGAKTVTTDNDGKAENVNITIANEGSTITFTSSVAKDSESLSNDYSKSVTIADNTLEIYVMPDNCLYWYGCECKWITGGWGNDGYSVDYPGISVSYVQPQKNTNNIYLPNGVDYQAVIAGTQNSIDITNKTSLRVIGYSGADEGATGNCGIQIKNTKTLTKNVSYSIYAQSVTTFTISISGTSEYISAVRINASNSRWLYLYAAWLE